MDREHMGKNPEQALELAMPSWQEATTDDTEAANSRKRRTAAAIAGTAVATASLICVGATLGFVMLASSPQPKTEAGGESPKAAQVSGFPGPSGIETSHMHLWIPEYELVKEAKTRLVVKDAIIAEEITLHTVCNVCGERIDGRVAEHEAETGHQGYTTDVPIVDQVEVEPTRTVEVVDVPASEHLEVVSERCPVCGETRSPESQE